MGLRIWKLILLKLFMLEKTKAIHAGVPSGKIFYIARICIPQRYRAGVTMRMDAMARENVKVLRTKTLDNNI